MPRRLTMGLIEGKAAPGKTICTRWNLKIFEAGDVLHIGPFKIEPFHVAHSIPDCVGFGITTPVGLIVHTGDYKFDHTPADGWPPDFAKLAEFSNRGVLAFSLTVRMLTSQAGPPLNRLLLKDLTKCFAMRRGVLSSLLLPR